MKRLKETNGVQDNYFFQFREKYSLKTAAQFTLSQEYYRAGILFVLVVLVNCSQSGMGKLGGGGRRLDTGGTRGK